MTEKVVGTIWADMGLFVFLVGQKRYYLFLGGAHFRFRAAPVFEIIFFPL